MPFTSTALARFRAQSWKNRFRAFRSIFLNSSTRSAGTDLKVSIRKSFLNSRLISLISTLAFWIASGLKNPASSRISAVSAALAELTANNEAAITAATSIHLVPMDMLRRLQKRERIYHAEWKREHILLYDYPVYWSFWKGCEITFAGGPVSIVLFSHGPRGRAPGGISRVCDPFHDDLGRPP